MKGLLSFIIGGLSFMIIAGSQLNAYIQSSNLTSSTDDIDPTNISISWSVRLISISIALIAMSISINYTRSGQQKMNVVNRVGRYFAILAILLCIIPIYKILLR